MKRFSILNKKVLLCVVSALIGMSGASFTNVSATLINVSATLEKKTTQAKNEKLIKLLPSLFKEYFDIHDTAMNAAYDAGDAYCCANLTYSWEIVKEATGKAAWVTAQSHWHKYGGYWNKRFAEAFKPDCEAYTVIKGYSEDYLKHYLIKLITTLYNQKNALNQLILKINSSHFPPSSYSPLSSSSSPYSPALSVPPSTATLSGTWEIDDYKK